MKKIIINLFLTLLFPAVSFTQGEFVKEESARTIAENFYFERVQSHGLTSADNIKAINIFTIKKDEVVLYYIINISTGGFVAVSAFNATPPVLCYAFSGRYEDGNPNENFRAWMEQYQRQIMFAINSRAVPTEETSARWKYLLETPMASIAPFSGREVLPMLTTTWDQGTYYNGQCPADPAGVSGHCVTGCVATAMGQLLNYFRWPESGTGSYSYECPPYGTLSIDFDTANYKYDLMVPLAEHSNTELAELLYHLGVAVDMVYGPNSSGMYNHKAAYALKTYFKYSAQTQYIFRDTTSLDWDSLLVSHLARKIPMYYAGWSVPDTNGHAFICDGYQGENFYHFNWGWSGSYDGYFYTENLTPGGNNFNLAQELIINAVPDTSQYIYPAYCEGQKNYTALFGTFNDGSGPLYNYENEAGCSWLITPSDSVNGITLNFLKFDTDTNDFVTVYDGDSITDPVLGTFSGSDLPPSVTTTGNSMYVVFGSGADTAGDGFLASYESVIPVFCGGLVIMSAQTDTLADGSGNWNYHDNSACLWRIMPEGASSVTLYFTEFETESEFDVLKVYDLQAGQVLAEYSGSYSPGVPDPVTSPSGKMFLTFNTNSTVTAPGWEAYYESNLVNVTDLEINEERLIFPNPTDGFLTIQSRNYTGSNLMINITDLSGRVVFSKEYQYSGENQIHLDLRQLSPGIYIMSSRTGNGMSGFHKIIKR
jgi:hypothetical protein